MSLLTQKVIVAPWPPLSGGFCHHFASPLGYVGPRFLQVSDGTGAGQGVYTCLCTQSTSEPQRYDEKQNARDKASFPPLLPTSQPPPASALHLPMSLGKPSLPSLLPTAECSSFPHSPPLPFPCGPCLRPPCLLPPLPQQGGPGGPPWRDVETPSEEAIGLHSCFLFVWVPHLVVLRANFLMLSL